MDRKVIIDPLGNILYKSFYISGLENVFGAKNIKYQSSPFRKLSNSVRNTNNLLFIVLTNGLPRRYFISTDDSYKINEEIYQWCDVYGSVNANAALVDSKYHDKLVSLCPSFGIRCWSILETIFHAFFDYRNGVGSIRKYLGKYKRLITTRKYLSDYYSPIVNKLSSYIFFCSTLWYNDEWNRNDEGVNKTRANFIRACKKVNGLDFEGGLVAQTGGRSSEDKFADCLYDGVSMDKWMQKTKKSILVFNTPAFWNCHGWKLGEYLALGKCIVSTKLSNDLPYPLEHGVNIHYVDNSESAMKEAIEYILSHPEYQQKLEEGARRYWNKYGTPERSLRLLGIE